MVSRESFAAAYETGRRKTINFLVSRGIPRSLAEETAQAAWVRGWERKNQLRDAQKAIPWVNSIALNIGRNCCRQAARFEVLTNAPATPGSDMVAGVLAAVDIRQTLDRCPYKERRLLERRYFGEWEIADLAKEGQCSNRAVRIQLFRARRRLRRLLLGERPEGLEAGRLDGRTQYDAWEEVS